MVVKRIKDMDENQEQALIVSWCLQNDLIPVAVPNGFNLGGSIQLMRMYGLPTSQIKTQNAIQMRLLKKEGLHVGFPDMMIFGRKNAYGNGDVLFLENKVKNNKPSKYQIACHEWLRSLGYTVEVSTDAKDAIQKIRNYFDEVVRQIENEEYIKERKKIAEQDKENAKRKGDVRQNTCNK